MPNYRYPEMPSGVQIRSKDLLHLCWRHQDCSGCLSEALCGWCPTSSTCVPNKSGIFAPIFENADLVCPLWSEGWELRSRPFGCHVSTITLLTCIVSVLATFTVIGVIASIVKIIPRIQSQWKHRTEDWYKIWRKYDRCWWKGWRFRLVDTGDRESSERQPLLGDG